MGLDTDDGCPDGWIGFALAAAGVTAVFFARLLPLDLGFALPGPILAPGVLSDLPLGVAFCGVLGGVVGCP